MPTRAEKPTARTMAFVEISDSSGAATLKVVGPHIAEALFATAIGLVAAIPAVMAYNFFARRIRVLRADMSTFEQDYLNIIRKTIADGQLDGAFRSDVDANTAAKVFFGALDEMATNWMLSRRKYDLAGDADAVTDLLIGGLAR